MISHTETFRSTDHYTVKCLCRRMANLEGMGWRISFMPPLRSCLCRSATQTLITCVIHHLPFRLTPRILRCCSRWWWQRGHVNIPALLNGVGTIAVNCFGIRKHIFQCSSARSTPSADSNRVFPWISRLNTFRPALAPHPPLDRADGGPNCHVQENYVSHAMSHLVSLHGRSSRNRLPQAPVFLSALSLQLMWPPW